MAKRKSAETVGDELFTIPSGELDQVLAGLPSEDAKIKLYRMNMQGRPAFLDTFDVLSFSEETIKMQYGGGKYQYVAIVGGVVERKGILEIEGAAVNATKPVYKKIVNGKQVFATPQDAEIVILPNGDQPTAQPSGSDSVMLMILQELRSLKENNGGNDKRQFLEELRMYKEIFASQPAPAPSTALASEVVNLIRAGIDLGANADGGGQSVWIQLAEKAMPIIGQAFQAFSLQAARQNGNISPVTQPAAPMQPKLEQSNQPMNGFDAIADKLMPYLPGFLQAASNNVDPANLVDLTLPNISESNKPAVIQWLQGESWFNDLCKLNPIISGQSAWWGAYRSDLLDALTNPDQGETE